MRRLAARSQAPRPRRSAGAALDGAAWEQFDGPGGGRWPVARGGSVVRGAVEDRGFSHCRRVWQMVWSCTRPYPEAPGGYVSPAELRWAAVVAPPATAVEADLLQRATVSVAATHGESRLVVWARRRAITRRLPALLHKTDAPRRFHRPGVHGRLVRRMLLELRGAVPCALLEHWVRFDPFGFVRFVDAQPLGRRAMLHAWCLD